MATTTTTKTASVKKYQCIFVVVDILKTVDTCCIHTSGIEVKNNYQSLEH